jgi:hypothetical protein
MTPLQGFESILSPLSHRAFTLCCVIAPFLGLSLRGRRQKAKYKSSPERAEDQKDGCSPSTIDSIEPTKP